MVLHAASLTMNCPRRRNEDEGIRNKVVLEARRQAKAALDKVEKYAVLATVDKQELTFPLLNIKTPVQEAMDAVKKELANSYSCTYRTKDLARGTDNKHQ